MKLSQAIEIKEHNRHMGILCPSEEELEADDLSIEALKEFQLRRKSHIADYGRLLPGETEN